ncbi:MAG: hypothetical protein BWY68_00130 [bacterium ADurb.Bin400]|nr:MAG: hypothetical protein BWY68_00130 [bacterium ADurb.Bin400]
MNIKYLGADKFEIKAGPVKIELGYKLTIDGFEIPGAGEYEKAGIGILGIPDEDNTIYVLCVEDINICYLGRIIRELSVDEVKEIGNIDILILPLGESGTLPTKKASGLVAKIDPKVVIPMLYSDLEEFKKIEGITDGEVDVYKVRAQDLPEDQRRAVILKPSGK